MVSGAEPEVRGAGVTKKDGHNVGKSKDELESISAFCCLQVSRCGHLQEKPHTLAQDAESLKDSQVLLGRSGGPAAASQAAVAPGALP